MRRRRDPDVPFVPPVSQLSGAIQWLRHHRVSIPTISDAFNRPSPHIRLLAHRVSQPLKDRTRRLSVRDEEDAIVLSSTRYAAVEALAHRVETTFHAHASAYTFTAGIDALWRLATPLGRPAALPLVRLKARILRHLAWLTTHLGQSSTSVAYADEAFRLWRRVYRQSGRRADLEQIPDICLIAANAYLLARAPRHAQQQLAIANAAEKALGQAPGVEALRQHSVAAFQAHRDAEALTALDEAEQTLRRGGVADVHRLLAIEVRRNLLTYGDLDLGRHIVTAVVEAFRSDSLEATMARNWTAATALCVDHGDAAEQLLADTAIAPIRYGHQATVSYLLALTPALRLPPDLRSRWVRYALYFNAFSRA